MVRGLGLRWLQKARRGMPEASSVLVKCMISMVSSASKAGNGLSFR